MAGPSPENSWTVPKLFDQFAALGRLRVISASGPSVFEAICEIGPYELSSGFLNIVTEAYHWHLQVDRIGHVKSRDQLHRRSNRRVLYFEFCEEAGESPFLKIYLYREPSAEFSDDALSRFEKLHQEFAQGVLLARGDA